MKYKLHSFFQDPPPLKRPCDHQGCSQEGSYRAPRNRLHLAHYFWFCLEHVRAYNEQWNYYRGMSDQDFEYTQRLDETWQRPTWPFAGSSQRFKTDFRTIFDEDLENNFSQTPPWFGTQTEGAQALHLIGLSYPYTRKELKSRYIELAKKYHPDANGGSRIAEEHLKSINRAYEILKKYLEK